MKENALELPLSDACKPLSNNSFLMITPKQHNQSFSNYNKRSSLKDIFRKNNRKRLDFSGFNSSCSNSQSPKKINKN